MPDPATFEEYAARVARGSRISGFGMNVTVHQPCPFCGAADHVKFRLLDMEEETAKVSTCAECSRSWKIIYTRDGHGVAFEIVQTGGADPPPYLPKMRRVDP